MKWMWNTAIVIFAVSVAVSAQSNESKMAGTMSTEYTGCIEAVNHGGSFLLTHLGDKMAMNDDTMMKKDPDTMPDSVALTGRKDLKKHVGQKVVVTGSLSHRMSGTMRTDRDTLTVTSLKVVAKSCS
jgi:hypothetical protein